MVKVYDCEIVYHVGMTNVVVDALNSKVASASIRYSCLSKPIISPLLDFIREPQVEGIKNEN